MTDTEIDFLRLIFERAEALPLLTLIAWAELRFLPRVLDAIAWNRAIGAKLQVTEAEAAAFRPTGLLEGFLRLFRKPPSGGPPPAVAVLLLSLVILTSACVPIEAVEQARTEAAIAHGHALDESLPIEARMIGADELRAWRAQHRALTGDDVPGADAWPPLPPELAPVTTSPAGAR